MTSIGETLRRERLRRKLDLDRISKELKISPKMLEAMETDRFDKLPGGVFTKSFVRQYARVLGLDDQQIAASLQRMLEPSPVQPDVHEAKKRSAAANLVLSRSERWQEFAANLGSSSSLGALALVVVVVLVCSAVYSWFERRQRLVPVSKPPIVAQVVKPIPAPVAPTKIEQTAVPSPQQAGSAERLAPAPVHVQLTAHEPVWVLATTDGKYAFSGTIEANASRTIEANDHVFLKLGNAGGVFIWLNGKAVGPLGAAGEVRRVQFTSGGFQLLPAEASTPGGSGTASRVPLAPL
jgi:cytoskeleton protein RodZ